MFEKHNQPLASFSTFILRIITYFVLGLLLISIALGIGMLGYHVFEGLPWIDAFLNASMILATMGPVDHLITPAGKIFAGFYALFSGLIFVFVIGVIFSPVIHRFFHNFHVSR